MLLVGIFLLICAVAVQCVPLKSYESSNCTGVSILNLHVCQFIKINSATGSLTTTLRVFSDEIPILSKTFKLFETTDYTYCLTLPNIPIIGDFAVCMYLEEDGVLSKDLKAISPLKHNMYTYRVHANAFFNETITWKKSFKSDSIDVTLMHPEAFVDLIARNDRTKTALDGSIRYGTKQELVINEIKFKNLLGQLVPSPFYDYEPTPEPTPEPTTAESEIDGSNMYGENDNLRDTKVQFSLICDQPQVPTQTFSVSESRLLDTAQNGHLGIVVKFPENVATFTSCQLAYNGKSKFCDGGVCSFMSSTKYTFIKDSIKSVDVKIVEDSVTKNTDESTKYATPYILKPGQKGPVVVPHATMDGGTSLGPDVPVDYKIRCDNKIIYEENGVYGFETPWAAPSANNLGGLIATRPSNCYVEMWYAYPIWLEKQKVVSEFFSYDVFPEAMDITYSWALQSYDLDPEVKIVSTDDVATIAVNVFTNFGSLVPRMSVTLNAQCVSYNTPTHVPTGKTYAKKYNMVTGGAEIDVNEVNKLNDMLKFDPLKEFPELFDLPKIKEVNPAAYKDAVANGVDVLCTFTGSYGDGRLGIKRSVFFDVQAIEIIDFDLHKVTTYITQRNPRIPLWQRLKVSQHAKDKKHAFMTSYELDCSDISYNVKLTIDESRTYEGANSPQAVEKLNQQMIYLIVPDVVFTKFDSGLHVTTSCIVRGYVSSASFKSVTPKIDTTPDLRIVHKDHTETFYDNEVSTLKDVWILPRGSDTVDEPTKDGNVTANQVDEGYGFGDDILVYPAWYSKENPAEFKSGNLLNTIDAGIICTYYDKTNTRELVDPGHEYEDERVNQFIGVEDVIRRDQGFIPNTMYRWGCADSRLNTDGSDYMIVNTSYKTEKIHTFYAPSVTGRHSLFFDTQVTTSNIGLSMDQRLFTGCADKECKPSTPGRCHWTQSRHLKISPFVEAGKVYPTHYYGDIGCCSVRDSRGYPIIDKNNGAGQKYYPNEMGFYDFFGSGSEGWVNGEVIARKVTLNNGKTNKISPFSVKSGWKSDEEAEISKKKSPAYKKLANYGTCFLIPASAAESAYSSIESLRSNGKANYRIRDNINQIYSHEPIYINRRTARHHSHIVLNSESIHHHQQITLASANKYGDYEPSPDGHDNYILADNPLSFSVFSYDPYLNELYMIDKTTDSNSFVIGVDADRSKFICLAQLNSKYNFEAKLRDVVETGFNNDPDYLLGTTADGRTFFKTNATMQVKKPRIDKDSFICQLDMELVVLNGLLPVPIDLDNLSASWHFQGLEIYEVYYGVKAEIKKSLLSTTIKAVPYMYNESLDLYNVITVNTTVEYAMLFLGDCKATKADGTFDFNEASAKNRPYSVPYYFWTAFDIEDMKKKVVIPTNRTSDVVCCVKVSKILTSKYNNVKIVDSDGDYTVTFKKDTEPPTPPTPPEPVVLDDPTLFDNLE